MSHGPLQGLKVIEFAGIGPAPLAGMMLADMGAELTVVERPAHQASLGGGGALNRGKQVLRLDLKSPAGLQEARQRVLQADALIEGFRPGVMERLGLGPQALCAEQPRLVYARLTGWGQHGPLAQAAGHDINYIALSGALHAIGRSGEGPVPPLNLFGDFGGGSMFLVVGVLSALLERQVSGRGQVVDAAMVDGASLLGQMMWAFRATGMWSDVRGVNFLDSGAPYYDVYETSDGKYMAVGAIEPQFYAELLKGLELDDADLPGQGDITRWTELKKIFTDTFASRTREEWTAVFDGTDACVSPVLTFGEAPDEPHMAARANLVEIDGVRQAQVAPRFSRTSPDTPAGPLYQSLVAKGLASNVFGFARAMKQPGYAVFGAQIQPGADPRAALSALEHGLETDGVGRLDQVVGDEQQGGHGDEDRRRQRARAQALGLGHGLHYRAGVAVALGVERAAFGAQQNCKFTAVQARHDVAGLGQRVKA